MRRHPDAFRTPSFEETSEGSFSAVSRPLFAKKYSMYSVQHFTRSNQIYMICTPLHRFRFKFWKKISSKSYACLNLSQWLQSSGLDKTLSSTSRGEGVPPRCAPRRHGLVRAAAALLLRRGHLRIGVRTVWRVNLINSTARQPPTFPLSSYHFANVSQKSLGITTRIVRFFYFNSSSSFWCFVNFITVFDVNQEQKRGIR